MPLYEGGKTQAQIKQGVDNQLKAEADLDDAIRTVNIQIQQQYQIVANAPKRLQAYREAVSSQQEALNSINKSFEGGLRTSEDILQAQSKLSKAQSELMQTARQTLVARQKLLTLSGINPQEAAHQLMDKWF